MARGDTDHDRIIAAYADGQEVADIEHQYGLSRSDIERIVAGNDRPGEWEPSRSPAPVMAAVVLVTSLGVASVLVGLFTLTVSLLGEGAYGSVTTAVLGLAVGALCGWCAYGLLRHQRIAQVGAIAVGAVFGLGVVGVALALLLIAPESSRDWFARR